MTEVPTTREHQEPAGSRWPDRWRCVPPRRSRRRAEQVRNLYSLSDPALSELGLDQLLDELLDPRPRRPGGRHGRDPARRRAIAAARGQSRQGHRGGGRAGRADPDRPGLRRTDRGRADRDLHLRCRPRRHPEPDPAREGDPIAARRADDRGGQPDRRDARRLPEAAALRRERRRGARAGRARAPAPGSTARGCTRRSSASIRWRWCSSAACFRATFPIWSASRWRRATSPRATRSAATGTT